MVESLKRSVEQLEPPTCPNCHIEMRWYRAVRVSETPDWIAHFFNCQNCNRITESRVQVQSSENGPIPPAKLSRPSRRWGRAA